MADDHNHKLPSQPMDTADEAWTAVTDRLRLLDPSEKARLANTMSIDCVRLARAGITAMEPTATEERIRYLLAKRRYGIELAEAAFGTGSC